MGCGFAGAGWGGERGIVGLDAAVEIVDETFGGAVEESGLAPAAVKQGAGAGIEDAKEDGGRPLGGVDAEAVVLVDADAEYEIGGCGVWDEMDGRPVREGGCGSAADVGEVLGRDRFAAGVLGDYIEEDGVGGEERRGGGLCGGGAGAEVGENGEAEEDGCEATLHGDLLEPVDGSQSEAPGAAP